MNWFTKLLMGLGVTPIVKAELSLANAKIKSLESENSILRLENENLKTQLEQQQQISAKLRARLSGDDFGALVG